MVALLYRFRWLIELFFRWLKCVLSCRHLISRSAVGIQIQMYCALIACPLVQLAAGRDVKPNQWTYKLLCLYAQGWASEEEVLEHLQQRAAAAEKTKRQRNSAKPRSFVASRFTPRGGRLPRAHDALHEPPRRPAAYPNSPTPPATLHVKSNSVPNRIGLVQRWHTEA